jgi:flagellar hook protein FlgE
MSSVSSIAVSGMSAASAAMGVSAHNLANQSTGDFRRQQLSQSSVDHGGVAVKISAAAAPGHQLEHDVVAQLTAKHAFLANLAVFRTSDAMAGSLLNLRA